MGKQYNKVEKRARRKAKEERQKLKVRKEIKTAAKAKK